MGRCKKHWSVYFMAVRELAHVGLFKVGMSSDVGDRIRSLSRPFYTHDLVWSARCRSKGHARAMEMALMDALSDHMLPRSASCDNVEYGASPEVVATVRSDAKYLNRLMSAHGPDGPVSLDMAIGSGHVRHRGKISIYDYRSASGEDAMSIFRRHAALAGADVPESILYLNPARPNKKGNSEWTAWAAPPLHVRHGPMGRHSKALISEMNSYRTTWRKERGRRSRWVRTGSGSSICNQQIFLEYLARKWPARSPGEEQGAPAEMMPIPHIPAAIQTS